MKKEKITNDLLNLFSNIKDSIQLNEISKLLKIKSESADYLILKDVLNDLVQKEIIQKSSRRKYSLAGKNYSSNVDGILRIINDKGYVETDLPELPKVTVRFNNMNTALDGDKVKVQLLAQKKGKKPHGEVIEIIERGNNPIVGTLDYNGYFFFIIPDDDKFYVDFLIPDKKLHKAKQGDKVSARLLKWDDPQQNPTAEITDIIGKAGLPRVEYDSIIKEFDLPASFPQDVIDEAKRFKAPANRKPKSRVDLRDKLIITIDPVDAKDFDDALSLDILENGNYQLGVHIADVSHYVAENTQLDIEARFRGNSIYLVDRVIPMLPEELSNEICSLKPNVPRYAFSIFIELNSQGDVINYNLHESLIINKRRYNYEEALGIIETGNGDNAELLDKLYKLSVILREKRFKKGGINFETVEYKFVLDDNKYPVEVFAKSTTKSTSLVEECMLLANQCVANYITVKSKEARKPNLPFLYRVHEDPDPKKLGEVLLFISNFGFKIGKKTIKSKEINKLLQHFENRPEKVIVHQVLIRAMAKAVYSHSNIGHYGLGFSEYSHFTSPIRRYPDLVVHRTLKEYLNSEPDSNRIAYLRQFMKDVGQSCTNTERLAMEAERASVKFTHTVMAQGFVGNEFDGTVTGVTNFGLFVQLDGIFAEGLLHIRDLRDDYYHFDEANFCLIGTRNNRVYSFGKKLKVKIVRVNLDKRSIDLVLIDDYSKGR